MGVKFKTVNDNLAVMENTLAGLKNRTVQVGAFRGDHAWLAGIHEYGLRIEVTPEMRAYLHGKGLHLKNSTTHIVIPERSFLRNGHDENADRIVKQTERALSSVLAGDMTIDKLLDLYGEQMATAIQTYMINLSSPPNHPFTIEQKGDDNPLQGTSKEGSLIESITWKKT